MAKKKHKVGAAAATTATKQASARARSITAKLRGKRPVDALGDAVEQTFRKPKAAPPSVPLPVAPVGVTVAQGETDTQRLFSQATDLARPLEARKEFKELMVAMSTFRQCYVVAYNELIRLIDDALPEHPLRGVVADWFVQYGAYLAARPFDEHALMQSLIGAVMAWMAGTVDRHAEQDQQEEKAAAKERELARRDRPIPIGFCHSPELELPILARDRSLVLVGERPVLLWLLDKITDTVLAKPSQEAGQAFSVLRMSERLSRDDHARLIRLASRSWYGCGVSLRTMGRMLAEALQKVSHPVDLLVCDDLSRTHDAGLVGRPPAASAGDGHRHIRRWCDQVGAAVLAAVPVELTDPNDRPDTTGPDFEQLRTFCWVRSVWTEPKPEDETMRRIVVGHYGCVFEATVAELAGPSPLILPGGVVV